MREERRALAEMTRVARLGVGLGLLNRHNLLYLRKGRAGGGAAYRGARWHTPAQARALFEDLPFAVARLRYAVFLPGGGLLARWFETLAPSRLPLGAFLCACAALERGA